MRKILATLFSIFCILNSSVVLAAPSSNSQEALNQLNAAAGASGAGIAGSTTDPRITVANIIRMVLGILGTIFLVLTVYAGFLWMTAGGEEDKIEKAKKLLYNGVIGLVIILSAYAISYFVIQQLLRATTGVDPYGYGNNPNLPPPTP